MWTGIRIVRAFSASGAVDSLTDPPGRIRRELVAAPPVELLDRPDQTERALLDQVEEGKPLVAVALRNRDDKTQVRLDHPLLRLHVAALDALDELDLLRGRQQRVPPGLAQEELERIRRRLDGSGKERGRRPPIVLADVEPARLELTDDPVDLDGVERVRLQDLHQLHALDRARRLGRLEQPLEVLALEEGLEVDRRLGLVRCRHLRVSPINPSQCVAIARSRLAPIAPAALEAPGIYQ